MKKIASKIFFIIIFSICKILAEQVSINPAKEPKIIQSNIEQKTTVQQPIQKQTAQPKLESEQKSFLNKTNSALKQDTKIAIQQNKANTKEENIAFVFASNNVGKYGTEASNVMMSYLLAKNIKFNVEFFDIEIENKQNITTIFDKLKEQNIKKVIVFFTGNSLSILNNYPDISKFELYLPLINKSVAKNVKSNFIFGGIDYKKQLTFLASKASSNIVEIYDDSAISTRLHNELVGLNIPNITHIQITGKISNYKILTQNDEQIKNSTIFLNTSIVKSAIILSNLKENNLTPKEIFSTQLNYSPDIFKLTTQDERENLFLTNSIDALPKDIEEVISLFGNDVLFSWVNYSVVIGLEYFITKQKKLFGNTFIKENQVDYKIKRIGFSANRFTDL